MAVLVVVLSCIPCADRAIAGGKEEVKAALVTQGDGHEDCEHEDACSPFCNCTCCTSFSMNFIAVFSTCLPEVFNQYFSPYQVDNTLEISLPIWQPPQLV